MVHGVKIGPRRRYCPWVKMGAWMRLMKGWVHEHCQKWVGSYGEGFGKVNM
jgi:hypothetical protein